MLEIGFGQQIPKLDFVSHLKISREKLRKNHMTKHTVKNWQKLPGGKENQPKVLEVYPITFFY